ncbi:hypothetical protein Taro_025787 [Colocasia esculenta]|uniref:Uncharacterized protein n=1 Tax=Colocasia esculenta TaxID=4460 RepID=A0A843VPB9_COLES|nr:hypothetical protein [Colocasia esculenta]
MQDGSPPSTITYMQWVSIYLIVHIEFLTYWTCFVHVGYFFNPGHQYNDSPHNDGEVLQGTINVISRLSRTTAERIDAMMEMDRFKLKLDIYRDYDLTEAVNRMSPGKNLKA